MRFSKETVRRVLPGMDEEIFSICYERLALKVDIMLLVKKLSRAYKAEADNDTGYALIEITNEQRTLIELINESCKIKINCTFDGDDWGSDVMIKYAPFQKNGKYYINISAFELFHFLMLSTAIAHSNPDIRTIVAFEDMYGQLSEEKKNG